MATIGPAGIPDVIASCSAAIRRETHSGNGPWPPSFRGFGAASTDCSPFRPGRSDRSRSAIARPSSPAREGNAPAASKLSTQRDTHGGQFDHASGTLEGVKRTKDAIDPLGRWAVALQRDKIVRSLSDKFARFGNELFLQSAHSVAPVRTQTCRTSSASATGFTR